MNHFDDRASYFAHLRDQGRFLDCLDNNKQQDISLCTFGAFQIQERPNGTVYYYDNKQDI